VLQSESAECFASQSLLTTLPTSSAVKQQPTSVTSRGHISLTATYRAREQMFSAV